MRRQLWLFIIQSHFVQEVFRNFYEIDHFGVSTALRCELNDSLVLIVEYSDAGTLSVYPAAGTLPALVLC